MQIEGSIRDKIDWLNSNAWLRCHGIKENTKELRDHKALVKRNRRFICLVDNGNFQAIGVAVDQREVDHFNKEDGRYKIWYVIDVDTIKEKAPKWENYKEVLK